jgi:hypothetical protein
MTNSGCDGCFKQTNIASSRLTQTRSPKGGLVNGYTDGGTYTFQAPDRLLATGKLGTGAWHRVASGSNE